MEPEILKSRKKETKNYIQKQPYPTAPSFFLDYIQKINIENITKIGVSQIQRLAKQLSLNDVFPVISKFSDDQIKELCDQLLNSKEKFLNSLCTVIFMCSDTGIDSLEKCGVIDTDIEHQGEKVISAYLSNPDKFELALNHLLFNSKITEKIFHIFNFKAEVLNPEIKSNINENVENECRKFFKKSNYGEFCRLRVLFTDANDKMGFFIEHGTNFKSKAAINLQDNIFYFHGRNLIGDCAFYDPVLKLVLISSQSPKNCKFYSKIIGKIFWNNENLFKEQGQLDLSFIKKTNLSELLRDCKSERIIEIEIKKIQTVVNNTNNSKIIQTTGKGCLTHNKNGIQTSGDITEIELSLKLNLSGKNRKQKLIIFKKDVLLF